MDKQYRTRSGREVRIFATDGGYDLPVLGAYKSQDAERWEIHRWSESGQSTIGKRSLNDLIEVKPTIVQTYWLGHYSDGAPLVSADSREAVERGFDTRARIAITGPHTVEFTEGEGL